MMGSTWGRARLGIKEHLSASWLPHVNLVSPTAVVTSTDEPSIWGSKSLAHFLCYHPCTGENLGYVMPGFLVASVNWWRLLVLVTTHCLNCLLWPLMLPDSMMPPSNWGGQRAFSLSHLSLWVQWSSPVIQIIPTMGHYSWYLFNLVISHLPSHIFFYTSKNLSRLFWKDL